MVPFYREKAGGEKVSNLPIPAEVHLGKAADFGMASVLLATSNFGSASDIGAASNFGTASDFGSSCQIQIGAPLSLRAIL